jgi:hypothetical protein
MIVILHSPSTLVIAQAIQADLEVAFNGHVGTTTQSADTDSVWPAAASWDDLLLVVYDKDTFPKQGKKYVSDYLAARPKASLLPIAIDLNHTKPPEPADGIKALAYDDAAKGAVGRLTQRVGCMLGLRLQGRDSKIFISYRASDGKFIADQLYDHFVRLGHQPWKDEAHELDGDTKILPGEKVQEEIDLALADASLVLLLDTPDAPSSTWIRHEVNTADGQLLPILPVVFQKQNDKKGPRFRSLLALRRWITFDVPDAKAAPLSDTQLEEIVVAAEKYQCEIFQRKCRVPFIVEKHFLLQGFDWNEVDKRLLMFESLRKQNVRLRTRVLSHCSIFDQIHSPAVAKFREFIKTTTPSNYSLFIYDGELLSEAEIEDIVQSEADELIILHHQELASLLSSNFMKLEAA